METNVSFVIAKHIMSYSKQLLMRKNLLFKQKAIRVIDMVHIMPFFSFVI